MIPKDIINNGSGTRDWVHCTFFGSTYDEVQTKKDKYLRQYPPEGYDTHMDHEIAKHEDGYHYVRITRFSTCD